MCHTKIKESPTFRALLGRVLVPTRAAVLAVLEALLAVERLVDVICRGDALPGVLAVGEVGHERLEEGRLLVGKLFHALAQKVLLKCREPVGIATDQHRLYPEVDERGLFLRIVLLVVLLFLQRWNGLMIIKQNKF